MSLVEPYTTALAAAASITASLVSAVARLLWWPINQLLHTIVFLLSPFWNIIAFLLLPFIRFGQVIIGILSFPFSVRWLERIETLYVYLGTAGLIGCITGGILFLIFRLLSSTLNIDATIVPVEPEKSRSAAEYRASKRIKKESPTDRPYAAAPIILKKIPGSRTRGLLSQAIIEEEDSDF